jgi:hypothetical protein
MGRTQKQLKLSLLRWINKKLYVELFTWKNDFVDQVKTAFGFVNQSDTILKKVLM